MRYVIVVDMQKDFVTGALGSEAAQKAAAFIANELPKYRDPNTALIFTQDTHDSNYMKTLEGKHLPVPHCILGTEGWEVIDDLDGACVALGLTNIYLIWRNHKKSGGTKH